MRTDVAGNQMRLPDRNIDNFFFGEFQFKRLNRAARRLDGPDSPVAAETVIEMNCQIADLDIRHIFQFGTRRLDQIFLDFIAFPYAVLSAQTRRKKFPLRQEQDFLPGKHHAAGDVERFDTQARRFSQAVLAQPFGNVIGIGRFVRCQHNGHSVGERAVDEIGGKPA